MDETRAIFIARNFHESYEKLVPDLRSKTRKESTVPWEDVPLDNKNLMIRTVEDLLNKGVIN